MSKSLADLRLVRPLAVLHVATTGASPNFDRVVEITVVKFMPDGNRTRLLRRVNPGIPLPRSTTAQNQITDKDLADCPPFEAIAPELARFLRHCDLCGAKIKGFALPFLVAEFGRAGICLPLGSRQVLDVLELDLSRDPRDVAIIAVAAVLEVRLNLGAAFTPRLVC